MAFSPETRLSQREANIRLTLLMREYGRVLLENAKLKIALEQKGPA